MWGSVCVMVGILTVLPCKAIAAINNAGAVAMEQQRKREKAKYVLSCLHHLYYDIAIANCSVTVTVGYCSY